MKLQALFTWMLRTSLAIAVGAMLFIPRPLLAQVDTGSILGTVTDASGAVIGGATVTLTNEGTNCQAVDHGGNRRFLQVHAGQNRHLHADRDLRRVPDHDPAQHRGERRFERGGQFHSEAWPGDGDGRSNDHHSGARIPERCRRPGGRLAQRQQSSPERPEFHVPGPARPPA